MTFSPGGNTSAAPAAPMLFGAPACAMCATELEWAGKGRRPKYCSKACSSKADRAREKEKRDKALAAAAETPRGETGLPDGLADDPIAAELLGLGARLRRHDVDFLTRLDRAARDGDPAQARQALADVLHAARLLTARHRELAEQVLDGHVTQAPAPAPPGTEASVSPRGETAGLSGAAAGPAPAVPPVPRVAEVGVETPTPSPRGEMAPSATGRPGAEDALSAPVAPRGETVSVATGPAVASVVPRGGTPGPAGGGDRLRDLVGRRLAQQEPRPASAAAPTIPSPPPGTLTVPRDPTLRGLPDLDAHRALDPGVFGDHWALAGWTVQPDVLLVLGEGHQVGWVERGLPGLGDRWIAVAGGYFIGDPVTHDALLHDTPAQAARTVQLAHLHNL
ncbi:hypothetical protein [Kitasatospora sp. NPDC059327]|uniref:hypothetical protein n=1 Tax=Kitasatospora sp. NPDC059327 TaxID=3346803 RepID=UPI0036BF35A6